MEVKEIRVGVEDGRKNINQRSKKKKKRNTQEAMKLK
jgi:hypothetical protein